MSTVGIARRGYFDHEVRARSQLVLEATTGLLMGRVSGRDYFLKTRLILPPVGNGPIFPGRFFLGRPVLDPTLGLVAIAGGNTFPANEWETVDQLLALLDGYLLPDLRLHNSDKSFFRSGLLLIGATLGDVVYVGPADPSFPFTELMDSLAACRGSRLDVLGFRNLSAIRPLRAG